MTSTGIPHANEILAELVRAPTITPIVAPALDVLAKHLEPAGFSVDRPIFGEGEERVENLFAATGEGDRHLALAGHVDVVPPGPEDRWSHPPFAAVVVDGVLYGRGAVDMKGGLAAMLAAAMRFIARRGTNFGGRLSLLVTGDEEGAAVNGTAKLLDWAVARGEHFTAALVGEPTSRQALGDQIKVGRRGSFSATLTVEGRQGHAAYPEQAENPVRGITQLLYALQSAPLDSGNEHFDPSTLEVVSVDVGNPAWNVIPAIATGRINSRYNTLWERASLRAEIERRLAMAAGDASLGARVPVTWILKEEPPISEPFLTRDEALIATLSAAIRSVTGLTPELSTGGGTSDARFIRHFCPVVEFGLVGTTMHQVDERVTLVELQQASLIYERFLDGYFAR
jgi:succinyl-diaminopimelate desuccinylase